MRGQLKQLAKTDRSFFLQAKDGIRDLTVTGVQTWALPIFAAGRKEGYVAVGNPVTPRELDETAARFGVRVEPGDVVVVRSGDETFRREHPDWIPRSEERRVGKEGRSRWWPDH